MVGRLINRWIFEKFGKIAAALATAFSIAIIYIPVEHQKNALLVFLVLLFLIYVGIAVCANLKKSVTLRIRNTKIIIKQGDLFEESGSKVIPMNEYFDVDIENGVIDPNSLHGQYIRNYAGKSPEALYTEIVKGLQNKKPKTVDQERPYGGQIKYKLGTIYDDKKGYLLLAYSKFDRDNRAYLKNVYFSREPFTTRTAIQAHDYAFRYFGGRTQMIAYDQDRVFVVDENFGNIVLVPKFEEYVKKMGFSVYLCRPHDPQSKGKVETFVRYIKESFLEGRVYKGIDTLNSDALRWLDAEGNGTVNLRTRKPPRAMFREEHKHLIKVQTSDYIESEIRSVSDKYTVKLDWSVYELPRSAVRPYDRVRIEEQDGMLLFYKAAENELIHKCPRRENPGGVTSCEDNAPIKDSVASNSFRLRFDAYDVAELYATKVEESEPRYKNIQLGRVITLANLFSDGQVVEAMEYCVSVNICTAAEMTAYLIYRYGREYVMKRVSNNAYYRNRDRAAEIGREQHGKYI